MQLDHQVEWDPVRWVNAGLYIELLIWPRDFLMQSAAGPGQIDELGATHFLEKRGTWHAW